MSKITLQKIFNLAWQAFIVEDGQPSVLPSGGCAYFYDGRKCAIGLAIPDGHPAQSYTGFFSDLVKEYPDLFDVPYIEDDRLDYFQGSLHDHMQTKGRWLLDKEEMRSRYITVAKEFNLEVPE